MKKTLVFILAILLMGLAVTPILAGAPPVFKIAPDYNNNQTTYALWAGTYVDDIAVTGTAQAVTVPAGANFVAFSGTNTFYVNFTTTATVPSSNVTGGGGSIVSPGMRYIKGITSFSIIAPTNCNVSLEWYF